MLSDIPYDITTYTLKDGSARPHRGDQSVYTSDMDVIINIANIVIAIKKIFLSF